MSKRNDLSDIEEWYGLNEDLKVMKADELRLRKKVFAKYFNNPEEGINSYDVGSGHVLKGTHKLNRSIDEKALTDLPGTKAMQAAIKACIKWKPSLVKKEYDRLSDKLKRQLDKAVITKPSTPSLQIVQPKR
jgi:hypothetical protein